MMSALLPLMFSPQQTHGYHASSAIYALHTAATRGTGRGHGSDDVIYDYLLLRRYYHYSDMFEPIYR